MTMDALGRLGSELAEDLRAVLSLQYPTNPWISERFGTEAARRRAANPNMIPFDGLQSSMWHAGGDFEECRFCRYRPQERQALKKVLQWIERLVISPPYLCEVCEYKGIELSLTGRTISEESDDSPGTNVNSIV
ncbi:hypothetical protein PSACC_00202 [Paramicrosporidium saccamoebae]|uniref:Uncharacterized protein n=1 Tax=Paramicrosporidium saccamoebae TaxID=1246581 RepID=A0A2H9TQE9_9FUNG|nr:hypothetical protein PSACC_00202 [Paramicrosporidium saccamoebae]